MHTVTSADGTTIAFERTGNGPPLVLVHGTGRDRAHWEQVVPALARNATVYAIDRRGRGGSGDADTFGVEREVEDVVAVLAAIGEPAYLLGHSYGAIIALEAALTTDRLTGLILYEPPFSAGTDRVPPGLGERLGAILLAGDREAVLVTFLQEGPRYTSEEIAARRARPDWLGRLALAQTLPQEVQAVERYVFDRQRAADMRWPTLLLLGSESPLFFRQTSEALHETLPDSELIELQGQLHNAMETAPGLFVGEIDRWMDRDRRRPAL